MQCDDVFRNQTVAMNDQTAFVEWRMGLKSKD